MIDLSPFSLEGIRGNIQRTVQIAQGKIRLLAGRWNPQEGSPVFSRQGRYTLQGWTEWTQGFQFGAPLLVYDLTSESWFLEYGRTNTLTYMPVHLTHRGVHDHGFNNISTYGNLLRLARSNKMEASFWEEQYYSLALRVSGAVQASRFKELPGDLGYIYSFNGPHSLFADTIRSLRSLAQAYLLGQILMEEQDSKVNLLRRLLQHAETTARYIVYFGTGRDSWDVRGRTAHEAIFNPVNGAFRNPSTQQGYSPFSTWTRGLAWILLGFAEELEFIQTLSEEEIQSLSLPYYPTKASVLKRFMETAQAVADYYLETTPPDGIPYWDTGAPLLHNLDLSKPADPQNPYEPVDSSAAAIAAQGLLRLAAYSLSYEKQQNSAASLSKSSDTFPTSSQPQLTQPNLSLSELLKHPYGVAGLRTALTLMQEPYLSVRENHEGLLLHAVYHRPNGWDYLPPGAKVPHGEACMWGDYHFLELALYLQRLIEGKPYSFFVKGGSV
ncbi:MAG: hypothetical protein SNJ78_02035 [Spirochaetales bacterium]